MRTAYREALSHLWRVGSVRSDAQALTMKTPSLMAGLLVLNTLSCALAQTPLAVAAGSPPLEKAQVLSATPVVQRVPVQRQICNGTPPSAGRCTVQTTEEDIVVAYDVTYTYAGKTYSVQMPYNPGPTLDLQVGPVAITPVAAPVAQTGAPATSTTVVVVSPAPSPAPSVWPWLWLWSWTLGPGGHPGPGPGHGPGHR